MATNIVFDPGYNISVVVSNPATPSSNDPIRYGSITGIAITDEGADGNIATETSVNFGPFIADFNVDDNEDSGISIGDPIYYADTPTGSPSTNLNNTPSGTFFGIALEAVGTSATTEIQVMHMPVAGGSVLAANSVGTVNIAAGAVTAAKLNGNLAVGFIPLPLINWREVGTNDIQNLAAHGGILAKDSTPILEFINLDTDSAIRMNWAASDSNAVTIQTPLPPDLDVTADLVIHLRAAMEGATDTPVIDADTFFNEADTKVEDASAAITGTSYAEYTITIAAADVPAGAQTMSVELTPAAHTTDALYVTAIWIEYTRTE